MVWEAAIPEARFVQVIQNPVLLDPAPPPGGNEIIRIPLQNREVTGNKTPAMMHACRQSREIMLKHYTLILDGKFKHPVYFDFSRDTLCLMTPGCLLHHCTEFVPRETALHLDTDLLFDRNRCYVGPNKVFIHNRVDRGLLPGSPLGYIHALRNPQNPLSILSPNTVEQNLKYMAIRAFDHRLDILGRFQSLTTLTLCMDTYQEPDIRRVYLVENSGNCGRLSAVSETQQAFEGPARPFLLPRHPEAPFVPDLKIICSEDSRRDLEPKDGCAKRLLWC